MSIPLEQKRIAWTLIILSALIVVASLAVPMFVIRPFVPQDANQLAVALTVRRAAPWLSAVCVMVAGVAIVRAWRSFSVAAKAASVLLFVITAAGAGLTHINIFEKMFKPYGSPQFSSADAASVDADDKVLAVTLGGQSHAYPIRTMGYHHIVNDELGGEPIAVTYCTLCHTGLVWSRRIAGGPGLVKWTLLTFRLAGINNGNALLRDEQTSSIWQQSTGEAIFGPFKGSHLTLVHSDELTLALWRSEQPNGQVLKPYVQYAAEYDPKDWESHVERTRTVIDTSKSGVGPHELMLGVTQDEQSKAFPLKALYASGLIQDRLGVQPILLVVGPDHASIRAFTPRLTGVDTALTFVRNVQPGALMTDTESGSVWNFQGCATSGKYARQCLQPIDAHKDYWFDWLNHNPKTAVFKG